MKKMIIFGIVLYLLGVITPYICGFIKKTSLENRVIYEVTIEAPYINLRPDISLSSDIIMEVYKGEKFKVVEFYSGSAYDWYKIIYDGENTGWIASGKSTSWVSIDSKAK